MPRQQMYSLAITAAIVLMFLALPVKEKVVMVIALAALGSLTTPGREFVAKLAVGQLDAPMVDLYKAAAATCPGMEWTTLAAVGKIESGHGANNGPSSAGAVGPMQFMPKTWTAYGVDANGDGRKDAWNQVDAVFGAANLLCANGAGRGNEYGALFAYNHADWYVRKVLAVKSAYEAQH
jgi:hypothetical protein